jgi:CxxC-x17-CxxC domain-containing protein
MTTYHDEQITCADCGTAFLFSAAEAAFYAEKGLAAPPKRCKECRAARKERGGSRPSYPGGGHGGHGGQGQGYGGAGQQRGGPPRGGQRGGPPRGPSPRAADGRPRRPAQSTGDVNEYRSPMQDSVYTPPPAWGRGAPRGAVQNDGNYRAPSFGGERAPRRQGGAPPPPASGPRPERAPRPRAHGATFDITCSTCGAQAQVPFKPIEGRDVFCQPCYRARKPVKDAAG